MLAAGDLDTTFGTGGLVVDDLGLSFDEKGFASALQNDGKIIVAGRGNPPGNGILVDIFVLRYNTDGTRDMSFGTGGYAQIDVGDGDDAQDVVIDPLGRIIIVGDSKETSLNLDGFVVARLTDTGQLDTTFDGDGIAHVVPTNALSAPVQASASAVALQTDGKIVVGGTSNPQIGSPDFVMGRFNDDGSVDTSFGVDGFVITDFDSDVDRMQDVAIQADGKIVAVGNAEISNDQDIALVRYNTDGSLDTSFGTGGKVTTDVVPTFLVSQDWANAVVIQADGKIVVGGNSLMRPNSLPNTLRDMTMARYNDDGSLDTTFNPVPSPTFISQPGTLRIHFSTLDEGEAVSLEPGPDGKFLIAGRAGTNTSGAGSAFAIARVLNNGSLDTSFSGDGKVTTAFAGTDFARIGDVRYQADGKILAVGWVETSASNDEDFAMARYDSGLVLPTAEAGGPYFVDEGGSVQLDGTASDSNDIDPSLSYEWDLDGDGIFGETGAGADNGDEVGDQPTLSAANLDGDSVYVVYLRVTNVPGFSNTDTAIVNVANVAPTLAISGDSDVDEGATYTLDLSSSDPGDDTITQWEINWGDSIEIVSGNPASATHTYADGDANYEISATATDEDGTFAAAATVLVLVHNVAPTLAISGDEDVDEGATYTLDLSSSDPGDDTITQWEINWGDSVEIVSGNPASVTHTYADGDAGYVISATATDEDGTFAAGNTVSVTVHNVAPTLAISGDSDVDEGATYTLDLSSSDPGDDTITQWEINWGDSIEIVSGNPASATHTYADGDAAYVISATATDEDGTFAAGNTVSVSVNNVAPTLAISGDEDVDEGATYTLDLSSSDPGDDTITQWEINWGDSVEIVSGNPASVTHTYADGDAAYVISATATDEDGTFAAGNTVSVTVHNVDPTADAGGPYSTFDDTSITLSATGSDVPADPLTFEWDLDGDSQFDDGVGANVTFDPEALGYSGSQVVTVSVRVSDGDGGFTIDTAQVNILGTGVELIDGVLHIVGSDFCDCVTITKVGSQLKVVTNFTTPHTQYFNLASITEIQIRMRGCDDTVLVASNVTKQTTIEGGDGNDMLTAGGGDTVIFGGAGHDVLVGGAGNNVLIGGTGIDLITGGSGRDLIVGGQDTDILVGGNGEDILIGGYTIHDDDLAALDAIMGIWTSGASFNSRVATLSGSGGLLQGGVAVFDDDDCDILTGGSDRDLIFADTSISGDGAIDFILLKSMQDALIAVN